jgi:hypothetical protein
MPMLLVSRDADGLLGHGPPLPHALPERLEDRQPYHVWIKFGYVLSHEAQLWAARHDIAAHDELGIILFVFFAGRSCPGTG